MNEIVTLWAGAGTIGSFAFAYLWLKARDITSDLSSRLEIERGVSKALEFRVTTLRGDNISLESRLQTANADLDVAKAALANAERQIGRMEAEARARKPKRAANGRFVKKPKPVACG